MSLRAFGVVALLPVAAACGDTPLSTGPGGQIALPPGPYVPGQSYFGRNGYVEYIAGNSPVILSVPHGGGLRPVEIADRTASLCGDEPISPSRTWVPSSSPSPRPRPSSWPWAPVPT